MKIYWCDKCKVPIIKSPSIDNHRSGQNEYLDLEDELIEELIENSSGRYIELFFKIKEKINKEFQDDQKSFNKIKKYINQKFSLNPSLKIIKKYSLKYLNRKKSEITEAENDYFCTKCNSKLSFLASDIRPVFIEERIMLSEILNKDLINVNIWNGSNNKYIIEGKRADFSISDIYNVDNLEKNRDIIRNKIRNNSKKINFDKFINYNQEHFLKIDKFANKFINNISKIYNNRFKIVSFSGGKDSTVISDITRRSLSTNNIMHVFGDTTLEFPFTYKYVEEFKNKPNSPPFMPVDKSNKNFFNLSKQIGPPSRVMNWCCTIFKTGPIGSLFNQMTKEEKILTFYGIRRNESSSRSNYDKISKSPKISRQIVVSPIIDWYDADIWLYLLSRGIDFNSAYRYGFRRVGCWVCPNNSKWSEFLSRIFMPKQYDDWRNFLINFSKKIGKKDAAVYVDTGKWKSRQGGRGLDTSNINLKSKPCQLEENAENYQLAKPITKNLYELFKPFGILDFEIGDKMLGEVFILDPKTKNPIIILQGNIGANQLKVKVVKNKNIRLVFTRIECQLRKYQLCINCGACENICPQNAISLNSGYKIDENKCNHCKKCIAYFHKGCIVAKTMADY